MSHHRKYPRTPHLPWSPGASSDDVWMDTTELFSGKKVVITEKMDGENTTMYSDHIHARSLDSKHHESRSFVKALHSSKAHMIPEKWRVCGENLFAQHAIAYEALPSYFLMFSMWDEHNQCLSWTQTLEWAELLDIQTPCVLYEGLWDETFVRSIKVDEQTQEGYVVRTCAGFAYDKFARHVAKWVRKNHVTTSEHWMHKAVIPNKLGAL